MGYRCVTLCFAVSTVLFGQVPDEPVYSLGEGVTPPRVVHQLSPNASKGKGFRVNGAVVIGLVVSSKGEPREIKVITSIEKDIDQAAVEAVQQWRFDPAKKDGKAVAVRISIEIRFHDM